MTDPSGTLPFTLDDVRRSFSAQVVARGEVYAQNGRVTRLAILAGGTAIAADVMGSAQAEYHVTIYISDRRAGRTIANHCECPIGVDCKHAAATLLTALQQASAQPAAPNVSVLSDPRVESWLKDVRETLGAKSVSNEAGDERIAYILRLGASDRGRTFPVELVVLRLVKTGRWTKVRDMNSGSLAASTARAVDAQDALVGRFLTVYENTYRGRAELAEDLLRRIIATGRAHVARFDTPALKFGPLRPATIEWRLSDDGTQRPHLDFNEGEITLLSRAVPWYVNLATGEAGPIDAGLSAATLVALLEAPALDPSQATRVRATFADGLPSASIPAPLQVVERTVRLEPVPMLTLRTIEVAPAPGGQWRFGPVTPQTVDVAEFTFGYGDATVDPASRAEEVRRIVAGDAIVYERSMPAETRAAKRLLAFGFINDVTARRLVEMRGLMLRFDDPGDAKWPVFLHRGVAELRADGWRVEIDRTFRHHVLDLAGDAAWHTELAEDGDGWFDLAIGLDVGDRRIALLPLLRDLLQQNAALADPEFMASLGPDEAYYVTLEGLETTLAFPADRLKAILATIVELDDPTGLSTRGALRLPRTRAPVLSELEAASGLRWDAPERLRALGRRLSAFAGAERVAVPRAFRGELRAYQRDGLDWLQFLARLGFGGVLADDMGLGKSVQTLAHLLCEKEAGRLTRPALLVVPTSIVHNWCDEAARFAPTLHVLPLHGPARAQRFGEIAQHDLVITTYALLVRDTTLRERDWHAVILDEAQALKNPQAKAAQVAMGLRSAHRPCLTGTPVENHLGDLWSLFSIALPGALGDRRQFGRVFRTPIEKRNDGSRGRVLAERIRPFLLRRTKEAVASELPEKTEIVQRVELAGAQRDLYETIRIAMQQRVRNEIAERGLARSQIVILDALLKLRQVCCDPRLLPPALRRSAESVKLDLLLEMLPQMVEEGRRVLLFSQFTSMLALIEPALDARDIPFVVLTGQTKDRRAS